MKRILIAAVFLTVALAMRAQDCRELLLPYFGGNETIMDEYPAEKLAFFCRYARCAFYVSDSIPTADNDEIVELRSLNEVKDKATGQTLEASSVTDMASLSYYAYTFRDLQLSYPRGNVVLCFPTPAAGHKYLVLRSLYDMHERAAYPEKY